MAQCVTEFAAVETIGRDPVLRVEGLVAEIADGRGTFRIASGVTFELCAGRVVALVGESGCGKTSVALAILRLLRPPARVVEGRILYRGRDLVAGDEEELRAIRGLRIAMVFQEPATSLNPVMRIGAQIAEAIQAHARGGRGPARARVIELLSEAGLPEPEQCADSFPHQLSSGMRQRAMIAMALACGPELLIADEATAALDATLQTDLLDMLKRRCRARGMALLLITHDLGLVARYADEVLVMYAGRVVEHAGADALLSRPRHPYTDGLIRATPSALGRGPLAEIPGAAPALWELPEGCKFQGRCAAVRSRCSTGEPTLAAVDPGHEVRCFFPQGAPA